MQHSEETSVSLGLCAEIRAHLTGGWTPPHHEQVIFIFFLPCLVPSFWVVSELERFLNVNRPPDDSAIVEGLEVCSEDVDSGPSGPIPSKRGSVAKAARVILPLPATFMPLLIEP